MSKDDKKPITGRMTCNKPNPQNIPIRTPEGKRIRDAFMKSTPTFIGADMSEIEMELIKKHPMGNYFRQAAAAEKMERGFGTRSKIMRKLVAKHNVTITQVYDSITVDGKEEDIKAWMREFDELFPPPIVDYIDIPTDPKTKASWEEMGRVCSEMKDAAIKTSGIPERFFKPPEDPQDMVDHIKKIPGLPDFYNSVLGMPFELEKCPACGQKSLQEDPHRENNWLCGNPECEGWESYKRSLRRAAKTVDFRQVGTVTGRYPTDKPNMANGPKSEGDEDE